MFLTVLLVCQLKHLMLSCNTHISSLVPTWNSICLEDEMYTSHSQTQALQILSFKRFKMFTDAMFGTDATADQTAAH